MESNEGLCSAIALSSDGLIEPRGFNLVLDIGGATLDACIVKGANDTCFPEVISCSQSVELGVSTIDVDLIEHLERRGDFQNLEADEKRWRLRKLVLGQRWKIVKALNPTKPICSLTELKERPRIVLTQLVQSLPTVEPLTDIIRAELHGVFQRYIENLYTVLDSILSIPQDQPYDPVVMLPSQDSNSQLAHELIHPAIDQYHSHRRGIRVPNDSNSD
jgi:hypothetical protein